MWILDITMHFGVRNVKNGRVSTSGLTHSAGYSIIGNGGVRPVVTLASDVQLESSGTNAWKFK